MNNPIEIALKLSGFSVERIADILGVSRQTINNYMKNPGQIPGEKIFILSQETGISMEMLYGSSKRIEGPTIVTNYAELSEKMKKCINLAKETKKDIEGLKIDDSQDNCRKQRELAIEELNNLVDIARIKGRKPTVCAFGPSDAGKSTLINFLIGKDVTPAGYTPMTTVPTYIKHISEKPSFLEEPADNAIVIGRKKGTKKTKLQYEDLLSVEIDNKCVIRTGNYGSVLEEFGTREGEYYKNSNFTIEALIVYIDSDILKEVTFIDIPGFGSGEEADDVGLTMDASAFDMIFILSTADAYMRGPELAAICSILSKRENLDSIYILATHANAIGGTKDSTKEDELKKIQKNGCKRIADTMIKKERERLGIGDNTDVLFKRCISFDVASKISCQKLNEIIENEFPEIINNRILQAIEGIKFACDEYQEKYENFLDMSKIKIIQPKIFDEIDKENKEAKKKAIEHLEDIGKKMKNSIVSKRRESASEMESVYNQIVNEEFIIEVIKKKGLKNKKTDIENLSNYLVGEINEGFKNILTKKSEVFAKELNDELKGYQENLEKDNKCLKCGIDLNSFDVTRAFAAGLAGLTAYGALAAWAIIVAQGSNLGAYILIAKVVSVLSTLGISVGGTASVAAFVASIGGPVTIGIALALIVAIGTFGVFTGTWDKRVAKKLIDTYSKKEVLNDCKKAIVDYWYDTEKALDACLMTLSEQVMVLYDEKISSSKLNEETSIKNNTVIQMLFGRLQEGYKQMSEAIKE